MGDLRIDRLLLTTDTTYLPAGFGPAETDRQAEVVTNATTTITRTMTYTYGGRYRLTQANYIYTEFYNGPGTIS